MSSLYDPYLNTQENLELNTNYFEGGYSNNLIGGKKIIGIDYRDGYLKLQKRIEKGEGEGYFYEEAESEAIDKRIEKLEKFCKNLQVEIATLKSKSNTDTSTKSTKGSDKVEELKNEINEYVEHVRNSGKIQIEDKTDKKDNAKQLGNALATIIQMFLKNETLPEIV